MKQQKSIFKLRVRKAHEKANFVGILYLLGALAMVGLVCMPSLVINGGKLWIAEFWKPFKDVFNSATRSYYAILISVLYFFIVLTAVVNFFKCFSHVTWLSKRSLKYVNGYNLNAEAMEEIGKCFSGSFAAFIIFYLIMYLILPAGSVAFTYWTYATLGAGLFIHFLGGLVGGKVSYFETSENGYETVEEKRSCRLFVYFFRNVVQIGAIFGIVWFFVKVVNFHEIVKTALTFKNPVSGGLMDAVLPLVLQVVILLCLIVLIKHATAATEYNHLGIDGRGMKNFRVFSFFTFLAAGGLFAVEYFVIQPATVDYTFLIIAGIAFAAFLIDCIFKSRPKYDEDKNEQPVSEFTAYAQPVRLQQNQQQVQQPIYFPVYYPMPSAPQQPTVVERIVEKPTPAPAPVIIQPMPAPQAVQAKAEADAVKREESEKKAAVSYDPKKEYKVRCPQCGKELSVKDVSPYHRCPACDKVFRLDKFQKFAPNPNYKPKTKKK